MNRRICQLVVILLLISLVNIQVLASAPDEENRVLYLDFLKFYSSFIQETMESIKPVKGNIRKENKAGMIPFSIKGAEGTVEGLLVKVPETEKFGAPLFEGWVDSFTITLKYPGSVLPVLGCIHALTADEQTKTDEDDHDTRLEDAYMKFNPDDQGEFHIENFIGQILDKSKDGLAKKVSFRYFAGTVQDAAHQGEEPIVPVDLDGFVRRWNFEGSTSHANIQTNKFIRSIKPKAYSLKMGNEDKQGGIPFTMVSDNKRVKVEIEGLIQNNVIQNVRVKYTPANIKYNSAVGNVFGIKRSLYALSGSDNQTGLMRYRDLYMIAGQFDHRIDSSSFASSQYLGRIAIDFHEPKILLESKPFNGYHITVSLIEGTDVRVLEYGFTLIQP